MSGEVDRGFGEDGIGGNEENDLRLCKSFGGGGKEEGVAVGVSSRLSAGGRSFIEMEEIETSAEAGEEGRWMSKNSFCESLETRAGSSDMQVAIEERL